AVTNIVSNFLLIPHFNILGAAFATLISYLVMAAGYYLVTQKFYRIDYDFRRIFKLILLVGFIAASFYYLKANDELSLPVKFAMLIVYISILLRFIVDQKEFRTIREKLLTRSVKNDR